MKILYIAPENTVGTLTYWRKIHESRGNECRAITFYPSAMGFDDDICLNLPFTGSAKRLMKLRHQVYKLHRGDLGEMADLPGNPPVWSPHSKIEALFFALRDWLWQFKIEPAIRKYGLLDFDVYHFEWGLEFYRNGNFSDRLEQLGKPMLAHYHGQDLRHRGVMPPVDSRVRISLTNEHDLLSRHPDMHYLFLPYDVASWEAKTCLHDPITICHATRNYYAKGSHDIIAACRQLEASHNIRFLLIDDLPHAEAIEIKKKADIYIDQVSNVGPGYGMNSIEAMSLGIACCTYMDDDYNVFLPDHPFLNVTPRNLLEQLTALVENPDEIVRRGQRCREWVEQHHGLDGVGDQLYGYYRQLGIIQ